jgi:hypothetical protein
MRRIHKVFFVALMSASSVMHASAFSPNDTSAIVSASRSNELRFARDYKGKPFDGTVRFQSASSFFGTMFVHFNGVYCAVSDQAILDKIIDWNAGQSVHLHGTIDGTTLGDISLKDCTMQ